MKITKLTVYPIKSLRGISLPSTTLFAHGLEHDRRYILLKVNPDGKHTNMFVGNQTEMALFHCKLLSSTSFGVQYRTPTPPLAHVHPAQDTTLEIPFEPVQSSLPKINIKMHTISDFPALQMPADINYWFSDCFGYEVILAYTGNPLGIKKQDEKAQAWISAIQPSIPTKLSSQVNFSDNGVVLVTSEASLEALHPRLEGEKAVMDKFRPNIVLDGTKEWDEDFWGELSIPRADMKIVLTSNCARCRSINVDLDKGKMGDTNSGKLLKKMMSDRRVDPGNKWEPIFGRYGFPTSGGEIKVGDEVEVSVRNEERSVWNGILPRLTRFEEVPA